MSAILQAADFAAQCHAGQVRKYSGDPYIYHPMRVAGRVTLLSLDEFGMARQEVIAAAWLHDVIEDCGVTAKSLYDEFGGLVMALVLELTNPERDEALTRAERKAFDRKHLMSVSMWAKIIKAVDRIDNLRDLRGSDLDFQRLYAEESLLLGEALLSGEFTNRILGPLVVELFSLARSMRGD